MQPTIQIYSGTYFNFLEPWTTPITIEDVAHALSNICRFGGHTRSFYSVAQHSVYVSRIVPRKFAMHGLLHDAPEAVLGDIPSPLKQLLPDYKRIEKDAEVAILYHFGLEDSDWHAEVKKADLILLATEQRDLMKPIEDNMAWDAVKYVERLPDRITPLLPEDAKKMFLAEYEKIQNELRTETSN